MDEAAVAEKNEVETIENEVDVKLNDGIEELKLDHNHLVEIKQANEKVKEAKAAMESRKIEYNESKAVHDRLVVKLSESIDEPDMPLFDENESSSDGDTPDPETWRSTPIQTLDLGEYIEQKLCDAKLKTIGDLADWSSSDKRFIDVEDIGESRARQIEEALDLYWEKNPQPKKGAVDTTDNPEAWRDALVTEIPISLKTQGILQKNNIDTLGELSTHLKAKLLGDIEGIGAETIKELTDKVNDYVVDWQARPATEKPAETEGE